MFGSPIHWPAVRPYLQAFLLCGLTAGLAQLLVGLLDATSLVLLFLLAVVLAAARWGLGPALLAAMLGVLLFNLIVVPPRHSLAVADQRVFFTFAAMLAVGVVVGRMTAGLRAQAKSAAAREQQVRSLYELSSELGRALTEVQVEEAAQRFAAQQLQARCWLHRGGEIAPGLHLQPLRGSMAQRGQLVLQRQRAWDAESLRLLETCATLLGSALERIHYTDVAQASAVDIETERLRNTLLATISHDLRTPLASLVGLAESLQLVGPLPHAEQREIANAMAASARRMSALVHKLLDMARLESGQLSLKRECLPVEEWVGAALAVAEPLLAPRRVELDLPEDLPMVALDAVLAQQLLLNLLENAAKYTPATTTVRISAACQEGCLTLRISDDGPGLPPGREALLFRKFERGEREGAQSGVGLGLALCQSIVQAHGGQIGAEARPQGGACFVLRLPLGQPPGSAEV